MAAGRRRRRAGTVRELLLARRARRACATPAERMLDRRARAGRRATTSAGRAPGRGDRRLVRARRLRARGPVGRGLPADRARRPRRGRRPRRRRRSRAASASGSCSTCCSPPTRRSCCSTSPTTSSTSPPSASSRRRIRATRKTVLLISHDRELLGAACDAILTLEGDGAWVHGGSYTTYPEAREHRQELLGDRLAALEGARSAAARARADVQGARAATRDGWAKKADAAETRWKRFVDDGPPPAPVVDQQIKVRLRGGDSARRVVALRDVGDRRPRAPVRRGDPLRRARRADRPERLGQDAPDPAARRRAGRRTTGERA